MPKTRSISLSSQFESMKRETSGTHTHVTRFKNLYQRFFSPILLAITAGQNKHWKSIEVYRLETTHNSRVHKMLKYTWNGNVATWAIKYVFLRATFRTIPSAFAQNV